MTLPISDSTNPKGDYKLSYTDLIFVFCFLPIYMILTLLCSETRNKNLISLIMSVIFIAWARPLYYALILGVIFLIYLAARLCEGRKMPWLRIVAGAVTVILSLFPIVSLGSHGTISGTVSAIGFILFDIRSVLYLKDSKEDGAEKNFVDLSVYLISFEMMAISPIISYSEIKDAIKERKSGLAMLSSGLERFICGLGAVTVLGYSLERLRTAALYEGSLPMLNLILGVIFTAIEIYVVALGYLSMSEGLMLMSGYRIELHSGCFLPKSLMIDHVGAVSPTYETATEKLTDNQLWLILSAVGLCVVAGISLGFGAGGVALVFIAGVAIVLQKFFETKKSVPAGIFTFAISILAVILCAFSGFGNWIDSLFGGSYSYLISYSFWEELSRSWVYMLIAIFYISPLRPLAGVLKRKIMTENENSYGTIRVVSTVLVTLLLVVSTVAMVTAAMA
ncbi:MAG: hypothetical protein LUG49_05360 [Oscillospiraceae bacterium]|nr:hypothetical protein [Oscillospiraceae bacterium]